MEKREEPEFRLDVSNQCLRRDGRKLHLTNKAFDVLRCLVERRDRLVSRDRLLEVVWPDTYVNEEGIRVYISELRRTFADDPKAPRFIETKIGRGYRFIGPILVGPPGGDAPPPPPVREPAPLFGRDAELERLGQHLERAAAGERQIVFVSGETGIGKTALVDAFMARAARERQIRVARGQCQELYGRGEAYMPVLEALERLGREAGHGLVPILSRHAPTWLVQMPSLVPAEEHAALLARTAGANPAQMLLELAVALETLSAETPLVLVLEDLHWSDGSTIDQLSALAQRQDRARLLVIGTCRWAPAASASHPLAALHRTLCRHRRCVDLPLEALRRSSVEKYLDEQLPGDGGPGDLVDLVYRLTGGNPLFLVTMVEDLLARGHLKRVDGRWRLDGGEEEVGVADTLQQMIQEKIEALEEGDQQLLEVGSAVGMEFSAAVPARVLDRSLAEVEERCEELALRGGFLTASGIEEGARDGRPAGRYTFLHTLYRSVVYQRLPAVRRVRLHRRIGEVLKRTCGERTEASAAALAMHFERGRDYRQAVGFHIRAARRALRHSAHREAIDYLSRGLDLIKVLPDDEECRREKLRLYSAFGLGLVATRGFGTEEAGVFFAWAHELGRELHDPGRQLSSLWGVAVFHLMRAEIGKTRELGDGCLREGRESGDPSLAMLGHRLIGMAHFHRGELALARDHLEASFALYKSYRPPGSTPELDPIPGVFGLSHLGLTLWLLGRPDEALHQCREVVSLAHRLQDPQNLACARHFAGLIHHLRGEREAAGQEAEIVLRISSEQGFPLWAACARMLRACILEDPEESLVLLEEAVATWERTRSKSWTCGYLAALVGAQGRAGQLDQALTTATEALETAERHGEQWNRAELLRLRGELLRRHPDHGPEEAEAAFRQALELARSQGARAWEKRAEKSLERLLAGV